MIQKPSKVSKFLSKTQINYDSDLNQPILIDFLNYGSKAFVEMQ